MKRNLKKAKERILNQNNNGITLIALVVTIVVLLILAGITVTLLTGENGLLTRATGAKKAQEKAAQSDQDAIDDLSYVFLDYEEDMQEVKTVEEFLAAIENGGNIKVLKDLVFPENTMIRLIDKEEIYINLNGHKLSCIDAQEENNSYYLFQIMNSSLRIYNGELEIEATINGSWNRYSTVLSVSVGGKLDLKNVKVTHKGGTDMNYAVDLLPIGAANITVNLNNCEIYSAYRSVRIWYNIRNSDEMINISIKNSKISGDNLAFWLQNPSPQNTEEEIREHTNIDIYNNNNTFIVKQEGKPPIMYFGSTSIEKVYYDETGKVVEY